MEQDSVLLTRYFEVVKEGFKPAAGCKPALHPLRRSHYQGN